LRTLWRLTDLKAADASIDTAALALISFSLGFMEGMDELSKSSVFIALFKVGHIVKLGFLLELQVVLHMLRIQFFLRYGIPNGCDSN
jgi:hypothetical protein